MIQIITGSTLGGAEYVGDHLCELLEEQGHQVTIHNQPDFHQIAAEGSWIIVTSTHGAGEFPDNIKPFIQAIKDTNSDFSAIKFAVIALGDSSYDTFCSAGKEAFTLMEKMKAQPLTPCFTIDVLEVPVPEDAAEEWLNSCINQF